MSEITLHPSLALTPFAKENLQELKFGPDTPLTPPSQAFNKRDLNLFGRCVQKIDQCNTRVVKIVRKVALIVLMCSLIGIPLVALHNIELKKQRSEKAAINEIIATLDRQNAKINKRAQVVELLGLEAFKKAPQLDLKGKIGPSNYIDFLDPKDLTSSIMKGQDKYGRAFISLKIQRTSNSQAQPATFVFTIFERSSSSYYPVWCTGAPRSITLTGVSPTMIEKKDLEIIRQIIDGKSLEYKLVS